MDGPSIVDRLKEALIKSVNANPHPFMTYKGFGRAFGLSDKNPGIWTNKKTLDSVAAMLKNDPQVGVDLTFLIRSKETGFPSVVDGKPYKRGDRAQQQRVREVADQIIAKFSLNTSNPYERGKLGSFQKPMKRGKK
jgi:hypothetical protein